MTPLWVPEAIGNSGERCQRVLRRRGGGGAGA